jgi:hypothetical protein
LEPDPAPVVEFHIQVADFPEAANLVFDLQQQTLHGQLALEMVCRMAMARMIVEYAEFTFDVHRCANYFHIKPLSVHIVAHQRALYQPQYPQFFERHYRFLPRNVPDHFSVLLTRWKYKENAIYPRERWLDKSDVFPAWEPAMHPAKRTELPCASGTQSLWRKPQFRQ